MSSLLRPAKTLNWPIAAAATFLVAAAGGAWADCSDDTCTRLSSCDSDVELPTAEECEADDCNCAQQIDCYVRAASPEENWPTIPSGDLHWNAFFWHSRFLSTLISPDAESAFARALDPTRPIEPLPSGTVLYKMGYNPEDDDPASPDLSSHAVFGAVKLAGEYCPVGYEVGGTCQGGGWFWYHVDSSTPEADEEPFTGCAKPTKCTGCHNTAQSTDWMVSVMIQRRYPPDG